MLVVPCPNPTMPDKLNINTNKKVLILSEVYTKIFN
jgi:hypothetical protein